jgi:hypothetical protein
VVCEPRQPPHPAELTASGVRDFTAFAGVERPEEMREVTRAHLIAWLERPFGAGPWQRAEQVMIGVLSQRASRSVAGSPTTLGKAGVRWDPDFLAGAGKSDTSLRVR